MDSQLLNLYFFLFTTFFGIFFTVHLLCFFLKIRLSSFKAMLIGVLVFPSIYAIYTTKGISILSVIAVISLVYYAFIRKKEAVPNATKPSYSLTNESLFAFLVFSILFLIHCTYFYDFFSGQTLAIKSDYSFYARLASYLRDEGIESSNIELFLEEEQGNVPYHYIEIWFIALISKLYRVHSQQALILIVLPVLYTTIYLGGVELVRSIKLKLGKDLSMKDYLIASTFLITVSCGFLYPNSFEFLRSDVWSLSVHGYHKLVYVYVLLIAAFLALYAQKLKETSLYIALIVICQVNVAPGILIAFTLFILYNLLYKGYSFKDSLNTMCLPILSFVCFAIFYGSFGEKDNVSLSAEELIGQFDTIEEVIVFVKILLKTLFQILIILLPFLILYLFNKGKLEKVLPNQLIVFSFIIAFSGLIAWGLFNQMHDSVQLWGNIFNPAMNILIFVMMSGLAILSADSFTRVSFFLALPVVIYVINISSKPAPYYTLDQSISEIRNMIDKENPKFAFIKEASEYEEYFYKFEQVWVGQTHGLMQAFDPLQIVCLSTHLIPIKGEKEMKVLRNNTFTKYIEGKRESNETVNYNNIQRNFIKEYNIDYLLIRNRNGELPAHFNDLFNSGSIGVIDGYRVYDRIHSK